MDPTQTHQNIEQIKLGSKMFIKQINIFSIGIVSILVRQVVTYLEDLNHALIISIHDN